MWYLLALHLAILNALLNRAGICHLPFLIFFVCIRARSCQLGVFLDFSSDPKLWRGSASNALQDRQAFEKSCDLFRTHKRDTSSPGHSPNFHARCRPCELIAISSIANACVLNFCAFDAATAFENCKTLSRLSGDSANTGSCTNMQRVCIDLYVHRTTSLAIDMPL